jgi:uncharacterized protein (TIGR03437 family)
MSKLFALFLFLGGASVYAATFDNISAASGSNMLTPDSIVIATGTGLTGQDLKADPPLQASLGGISVQVVDNMSVVRLALIYTISSTQIKYVLPAGTAPGMVTVNILNNGTPTGLSAQAQVQAVAPSLFSANGDGKGVAAASAMRIVIPTGFASDVTVFQCGDDPGSCTAVPVDPGLDAPVYISFYGTGLRGAKNVSVTIGGLDVPVLYTGPQPTNPGLDQINVPVILSLRGKGLVDVVVTADGLMSNPVQVNIQ